MKYGDAINVRSMNELLRGPSDLYNARHAANRVSLLDLHLYSNQGSTSENSSDAMWISLKKTERDESIAKSSIFMREWRVHSNFFAVVASDRHLK